MHVCIITMFVWMYGRIKLSNIFLTVDFMKNLEFTFNKNSLGNFSEVFLINKS